ncbi:hypothetical protein PVT68_02830 [Microbulbifer bruguierae]|uniref:Phosphodiesterase n=1 Tax=Microbulbifer bruguierae TaxID=3029061 RepID=A0ABY8NEA1_9GAMM|nr:hypothetical protein [Microbulbifer bruguierae]WGL17243.1 hypothetical protein PVT68_02830 [Microbulbifer bruguierae]
MFSTSALRNLTLAGLVGIAVFASAAQAEEIEVPVGSQGYIAEASHLRGKKQEQVSEELGEPLSIQGPVGEPAITRWEYADFFVYFEYDRVLHTVAKKHQG